MDDKVISFLTDLDTLFDTRMGVIESYGSKAVEDVVRGGYFSRVIDEFEGIDPKDFKERYAKRNIDTLRKSMITAIVELALEFVRMTLAANASSPMDKRPRIVVNTYPYVLDTVSEKSIYQGLTSLFKGIVEVTLIHLKPEDISLRDIKSNYAIVALYHYSDWLENLTLNGQLKAVQCPQVALYGPRILNAREGLSLLKVRDVFTEIEQYGSIFFRLILADTAMFCTDMDRLAASLKREAAKS